MALWPETTDDPDVPVRKDAERLVLERILNCIAKRPAIGVVGISSFDTMLAVQAMPGPGGFAIVEHACELPGGTSANAAVAAAKLGARVELISAVGNDSAGKRIVEALGAAGVDVSRMRVVDDEATDRTTVISSGEPANRTLFWKQGVVPRMGDRIDIDRLFTRHLVLLDSVDPGLRRFLIDLPVHTYPDVKILAPMTYVVDFPGPDEMESIIRCDALVGSERELLALTQCESLDEAIRAMQERMRSANLRSVAITQGARGALAFDASQVFSISALDAEAVDTTGAGDAFAGALAVGLATRLDLLESLMLANCVAGLSVRSLGAQSALPTAPEVEIALRRYLDRVRR